MRKRVDKQGLRILIIRFSSIGDIVLTTALIRNLKKTNPSWKIDFLTKKENSIILENNPYINRVIPYEGSFSSTLSMLKQEGYDFVIDSHSKILSILFAIRLRRPWARVRKGSIKKSFMVGLKLRKASVEHIADLHIKTGRKLGVENDGEGLDYFLSEKDYEFTLPEGFEEGYIALVAGAKHFTKQIPKELMIEICKHIDRPIVILGDGNDGLKAEEVIRAIGDDADKNREKKIYNACGKYNLNQSSAIIDKSLLVITSDTGLMHIASALNKDIISIWGNTVPEFGLHPYMPRDTGSKTKIFEIKDLKCRPCSRIGFDECPKKHFRCMLEHSGKEIGEYASLIIRN